MPSSSYKIIFGLLTKPATNHLLTIHVVSVDQKGATWNKACQWCNCTYGWAGNGSKDTSGRSHRYGPESQSLQICYPELSFLWQNTVAVAGLGLSDVAEVPAGTTPSRKQGKHLWRALGSQGDPPCSSGMALEQCLGTAGSPMVREEEQRIPRGKWETAARRLLKITHAAKPRWLRQLSPKTVSNSSSFRIFNN